MSIERVEGCPTRFNGRAGALRAVKESVSYLSKYMQSVRLETCSISRVISMRFVIRNVSADGMVVIPIYA